MKSLLFTTVFCIFLFSSCKDIKDPELRGFDSVVVKEPGLKKSIIQVNVRYYNPNKFNARLKEAHGEAWVENIHLGTFKVDSLIKVPANSEFVVPVDLTIETYKILGALVADEVTIKITGSAKAGKGGFYKTFSLNYEGKQNIRKYFGPVPITH
jgi:LEA14-like dessication related protein